MKKNNLVLAVLVLSVLACGVITEIPVNASPAPTGQPTAAETRPARLRTPVTAETPVLMVVCVDHANARAVVSDTLAVVVRLVRGDKVTLTGEVIEIGGEKWQPTNYGLIDPKLICEVK